MHVEKTTPVHARCLVVDDDDWSRQYIVDVLHRFGITAETARDGLEAAALLDDNAYDLVFLDLDLPKLPGEAVLEGMIPNRRRPGMVVVMSGSVERLEKIELADWERLGISAALPKPLAVASVRAAVEGAIELSPPMRAAWSAGVGPGTVVMLGTGLWVEALSRVVTRGGGMLVTCKTEGEALERIHERKPPVVVVGPPATGEEMFSFFVNVQASSPRSTVFAALAGANQSFSRDLVAMGISRAFDVPGALGELAIAIVTAATLNTRNHPRVPVASGATVITKDARVTGVTRDVSEGGVCLHGIKERIPRGPARVEFALPDSPARVSAESHVVWVAGSEGEFRAGVRFEGVSDRDRYRIRQFVQSQLA